jgi:hypothetical protein
MLVALLFSLLSLTTPYSAFAGLDIAGQTCAITSDSSIPNCPNGQPLPNQLDEEDIEFEVSDLYYLHSIFSAFTTFPTKSYPAPDPDLIERPPRA